MLGGVGTSGGFIHQSPNSVSPTGGTPSAAQQYGTELVMLYDYKVSPIDSSKN